MELHFAAALAMELLLFNAWYIGFLARAHKHIKAIYVARHVQLCRFAHFHNIHRQSCRFIDRSTIWILITFREHFSCLSNRQFFFISIWSLAATHIVVALRFTRMKFGFLSSESEPPKFPFSREDCWVTSDGGGGTKCTHHIKSEKFSRYRIAKAARHHTSTAYFSATIFSFCLFDFLLCHFLCWCSFYLVFHGGGDSSKATTSWKKYRHLVASVSV